MGNWFKPGHLIPRGTHSYRIDDVFADARVPPLVSFAQIRRQPLLQAAEHCMPQVAAEWPVNLRGGPLTASSEPQSQTWECLLRHELQVPLWDMFSKVQT